MSTTITNLHSHCLHYDNLRRTPNGLIFTEDLATVYSIFLICMNLKSHPDETKGLFSGIFKKVYPYSFSMKTAIITMKHLEIKASSNVTCINLSYHIKEPLARYLLITFMEAKLLHTPADRTRNEPKEKVLLQPTPKGVAILTKYCKDIGLKKIPDILVSELNSITLFNFERSSITDSLIHSDKLLHILLIKIMGDEPNIWTPDRKPDKLPTLSQLLENSNDIFTFENVFDYFHKKFLEHPNHTSFNQLKTNIKDSIEKKDEKYTVRVNTLNNDDIDSTFSHNNKANWFEQIPESILNDTDRKSPLSHKYFTNPDSDAHVQYYASDTNLRLFYNRQFMNPNINVKYCFTSKVLWQWLMDCTNIMYPGEAIALSALFLKLGLICPIVGKPSNAKSGKFCISRSSFFTLSTRGWNIINWDNCYKKCQDSNALVTNDNNKDCNDDNKDYNESDNDSSGIHVKGKVVEIEINSVESIKTVQASIQDTINQDKCSDLPNLEDILSDPGMRYLFRKHLEREFCVENLDVYLMIRKFLKRMTILKKYIDDIGFKPIYKYKQRSVHYQKIIATRDSALYQQANECLEIAFQIYSCFIMKGAPYQLNLDHKLREEISLVILSPHSPIKEYFNIEEGAVNTLTQNNLGNGKNISEYGLIEKSMDTVKDPRGNRYDDKISRILLILKELYPLFEEVSIIIYRLMEIDSLSKFYNSKEFGKLK